MLSIRSVHLEQNSKLRIHSKPDRNQSKLTVWIGYENIEIEIPIRKKNLTYLGVGQLKISSIISSILIVIHFVTDQICGTIWIFSIFVFSVNEKCVIFAYVGLRSSVIIAMNRDCALIPQ